MVQLAETGLQMAFDDFVIERNLVSCLRTNEARRKNSGRAEYSCLQTEGRKTAEGKKIKIIKCRAPE